MDNQSILQSPSKHNLLPAETIDNIIDYLHDDVTTLAASSLVCRAWLPACRYHLFQIIRCIPGSQRADLPHLRNWLHVAQDVRPYIKMLLVTTLVSEPLYPEVLVEELEQIISCLPLLHHLALRRVTLSASRKPLDDSYISPTSGSRSLGTLALMQCISDTPHPFFFLFGLFAKLEKLNVQWAMCAGLDIEEFATASRRLDELAKHLRGSIVLTLLRNAGGTPGHEVGLDRMICSFVNSPPDGSRWPLQEITLSTAALSRSDCFGTMIYDCRETLEELTIDICFSLYFETTSQEYLTDISTRRTFSIAQCERLRTLMIFFDPVFRQHLPASEFYSRCITANTELVKAAPLTLKSIMFFVLQTTIVDGRLADWDDPDLAAVWRDLDDAVMALPALEAVEAAFFPSGPLPAHADAALSEGLVGGDTGALSVFLNPDKVACTAFLGRVLPRVHAKGILNVFMLQ